MRGEWLMCIYFFIGMSVTISLNCNNRCDVYNDHAIKS